jgi:hypothetical protein
MLVQTVDDVSVRILKSNPPQLQIVARGWTNTGGWSNIRLESAPTIDPGRTMAFNMIGDPPTGNAIQVLTRVNAFTTIVISGNLPENVRVNAGSNSVSASVAMKLSDGMNLGSAPAGYDEEYGVAEYRAVRIGAEIFVRCSGELPNFNEYADLRKMPWRIWPPQLGFFRYIPPITMPALRPFGFVSRFDFPTDVAEVIINDANGQNIVGIHEPSVLAKFATKAKGGKGAARAVGYGDNMQEAIDHAILQLPPRTSDGADILFRYTVVEQGKLVGGFPGFDIFFAEVERNP